MSIVRKLFWFVLCSAVICFVILLNDEMCLLQSLIYIIELSYNMLDILCSCVLYFVNVLSWAIYYVQDPILLCYVMLF